MNVKVTVTVKSDLCLVCGKRNKGIHFNVAACRACAAFFRRAMKARKVYKCQHGTRDCNLKTKVIGTPLCRYCRLHKCKQLGMVMDKDKATASDLEQENNPKGSSKDSNLNILIPASSNSSSISNIETFMKLSSIEEQVKGILAQPHAFVLAPGIRLIFMQQLEYGFNEYDEEIKPKEDLVILTEIDHEIDEKFNDRRTVALAKMLMYCKQFAELDFTDKLLLYKHLKDVFWDIERFYRSALLARNQSLFLLYDNRAVNLALDEPTFIKNSDKESFAKTLPLLYPVRDKMVNLLLNPIKSLNLSQTELVYLCAIILWTTIDINDISPNAQRVAEEVSEQILNGLHNYYVYEKHLVNYAPRLVKLLKLIDASKVVKSAFTDAALLSQVYNIYDFNVNLSELVNT